MGEYRCICVLPLADGPWLHRHSCSCFVSNRITIKSFVTCNKLKQIPFSQSPGLVYTPLFTANNPNSNFCCTSESYLSLACTCRWRLGAFRVYPTESIEPVRGVNSDAALKTNPGPNYDLKAAIWRLKSWCQSLALLEPECCWKWDLSQTIWFNLHSWNSVFTSWLRKNISVLWYFYDIKYSIRLRWVGVFCSLSLLMDGRDLCAVFTTAEILLKGFAHRLD